MNIAGSSRMELQPKPSMTSVAESHRNEEDEEGDDLAKSVPKPLWENNFKLTQSGLSQASLTFGKTIHNSNFKKVGRSTI